MILPQVISDRRLGGSRFLVHLPETQNFLHRAFRFSPIPCQIFRIYTFKSKRTIEHIRSYRWLLSRIYHAQHPYSTQWILFVARKLRKPSALQKKRYSFWNHERKPYFVSFLSKNQANRLLQLFQKTGALWNMFIPIRSLLSLHPNFATPLYLFYAIVLT